MDRDQRKTPVESQEESLPPGALCSCASDCAAMLKVVADANRILILRTLIREPLSVSQICEATGLAQQRVSHHLGRMRPAGLVTAERDGRNVIYRVSPRIAADNGIDLGCCRLTFRAVPRLPKR